MPLTEDISAWIVYRWYLDEVEQFLLNMQSRYKERFEVLVESAMLSGDPEVNSEVWHAHLSSDIVKNDFPALLRSSFFLALYGFFEAELKDICQFVLERPSKRAQQSDGLSDIGSRIWKLADAKECLSDSADVDITRLPRWKELTDYCKIRNCLAHSQGFLSKRKDDSYLETQYFRQEGVLGTIRSTFFGEQVILGPGFCEQALEHTREFLNALDQCLTAKGIRGCTFKVGPQDDSKQ